MNTTLRITLTAGLALTTACASFEPPSPTILDSRLMVGNMAARNSFELRNQPAEPRPVDTQARTERKRPVTPILFWLGIGMVSVGGISTITTSALGFATQRQLQNGYQGNITNDERLTLESRGANVQKAAIASIAVTFVGAVLTAAVYGFDYTTCGPLAPKRRRDNAPTGRCKAADAK